MQGEEWSPDAAANEDIIEKGITHTSMMVGDIVVTRDGIAHMVLPLGFKEIGKVR